MSKTFVEIGSCDFDTCVPLAKQGWNGIIVEPVDFLAENVRKDLSGNKNAKVIEKVVSDYDGEIDFHISNGDDWARGISSVSDDNHLGVRMFDIYDGVNRCFLKETKKLPCVKLDTLLEENDISSIDYLKLDTEGHEMNILLSYSWKIKPTFIKMEHKHIDDKKMKQLLEKQGYIVYTESEDMYAIGG